MQQPYSPTSSVNEINRVPLAEASLVHLRYLFLCLTYCLLFCCSSLGLRTRLKLQIFIMSNWIPESPLHRERERESYGRLFIGQPSRHVVLYQLRVLLLRTLCHLPLSLLLHLWPEARAGVARQLLLVRGDAIIQRRVQSMATVCWS